jgi:hypothetical protein
MVTFQPADVVRAPNGTGRMRRTLSPRRNNAAARVPHGTRRQAEPLRRRADPGTQLGQPRFRVRDLRLGRLALERATVGVFLPEPLQVLDGRIERVRQAPEVDLFAATNTLVVTYPKTRRSRRRP